jgi:hypothetical protein
MLRRSVLAGLVAVSVVAGSGDPASATGLSPNCDLTYLRDGVGGYSVSVAGKTVRIPEMSNVNVCVKAYGFNVFTDFARVNTGCGPYCFDVLTPVSIDHDHWVHAAVCYTADGANQCIGGDYSVAGHTNLDQECIISMGAPATHNASNCLVVFSDDLIN